MQFVFTVFVRIHWGHTKRKRGVSDNEGWNSLFVLGFNDTPALVGHFVSSPREREKRYRRDSKDERERDRGEGKMNDSQETEEIKTFPFFPYLLQG